MTAWRCGAAAQAEEEAAAPAVAVRVVNLDRRRDRLGRFTAAWEGFPVPLERFAAVDGRWGEVTTNPGTEERSRGGRSRREDYQAVKLRWLDDGSESDNYIHIDELIHEPQLLRTLPAQLHRQLPPPWSASSWGQWRRCWRSALPEIHPHPHSHSRS